MIIVNADKLDREFFEPRQGDEGEIAREILADIRKYGESALRKYSQKFDDIGTAPFKLTGKDINAAYEKVDSETLSALREAAKSIEFFARKQMSQIKDFSLVNKGVILGQKVIPLIRVGCYVPGGIYPLPSSALMSIIPAKIAGVEEIIVCSPRIKPATVAAADIAGADMIFNIGGAQAIGAMAYGTESVPKVDKIVGPGNKYVAAAKKEVYGRVGIDFIAGPSEVLIIADETGKAELIAADLLAQAEHDKSAQPNLVTTSRKLAIEVQNQLEMQLQKLKTRDIAAAALQNGRIIIAQSLEDCAKISDMKSPEHLELHVKNPERLMLKNYGSLFIGDNAAEVFGDYCTGTNHILPTNGAARYTGGLSVRDFVKIVTYQKIDGKVPASMVKVASRLAEQEGLDAHRKAALLRVGRDC
ncbi:histidinol dehydrogenase [Candidatus Woesearchaeota archaeon]|nr:histidinol dehydrogenase [Candidatus Woesearchaeota archaeon]